MSYHNKIRRKNLNERFITCIILRVSSVTQRLYVLPWCCLCGDGDRDEDGGLSIVSPKL